MVIHSFHIASLFKLQFCNLFPFVLSSWQTLASMAGPTDNSSQSQVDEKADIQRRDGSDVEKQYGHLEVTSTGVTGSVAESEKDIPVGEGPRSNSSSSQTR